MHAEAVLQKCLWSAFSPMHATRARALLGAVGALLKGRRLILMDLARSWPGAERVRAPLKRLDRLLSNRHLQQEGVRLYGAMGLWLLRQPRPLISIDWSDLQSNSRYVLVRAGVPVGGRTLTLFERIYPLSKKGSPKAQAAFLRDLRKLIPEGVTPIIVTDAGFRTPWFEAVERLGWYFVGRLRSRTRIRLPRTTEWFDNRELYKSATSQPRRLDDVDALPKRPWRCDMVLYRRARQGRYRLTRQGARSRGRRSVLAEKREKDPWLLVVSPTLRELTAQQIVAIYSKRMQIEQSFRDLKCDRLGCAFCYSLTRRADRLAVLLLIHALATFVAWLYALRMSVPDTIAHGGVVSRRPARHYSLLRIAWEALRRTAKPCSARELYLAYRHPPPWFLANLQVPA